jgi:ribosomal protein S15P/S13E
MERRILSLTKDIDKLIKFILPHTVDFHSEVKLLINKGKIHKKIDELVERYDKLIKSLERE